MHPDVTPLALLSSSLPELRIEHRAPSVQSRAPTIQLSCLPKKAAVLVFFWMFLGEVHAGTGCQMTLDSVSLLTAGPPSDLQKPGSIWSRWGLDQRFIGLDPQLVSSTDVNGVIRIYTSWEFGPQSPLATPALSAVIFCQSSIPSSSSAGTFTSLLVLEDRVGLTFRCNATFTMCLIATAMTHVRGGSQSALHPPCFHPPVKYNYMCGETGHAAECSTAPFKSTKGQKHGKRLAEFR